MYFSPTWHEKMFVQEEMLTLPDWGKVSHVPQDTPFGVQKASICYVQCYLTPGHNSYLSVKEAVTISASLIEGLGECVEVIVCVIPPGGTIIDGTLETMIVSGCERRKRAAWRK